MTDPSTHDAALAYAEQGWRVVPLHYPVGDGSCSCGKSSCNTAVGNAPVGKHPRLTAWQDRATVDLDKVDAWFERDPRNNVGIATGSGLVVLDIDPKDGGFETLDALLKVHGDLPTTPTVETGSGGRHYYFHSSDEVRNSAGKLGAGLDIRGDGGQVVAPPSLHKSGQRYSWLVGLDDEEPAELPGWIPEELERASKPRRAKVDQDPEDVIDGKRNDWLTSRAGSLRRLSLDTEAIHAALVVMNRAKCKPPLDDDEVLKIAKSVASYAPGRHIPQSPDDWENKLRPKLDRKGNEIGYMPTRRNVAIVLSNDSDWRGKIWFDATRSRVCFGDQSVEDSDFVAIANTLDKRYDWHSLKVGLIHEAVLDVAHRHQVDVLSDYLESLTWDGETRMDQWLYHGLGAEWSDLSQAYSRKFMIQAVARALRPGCQADTVLILVGPQGAGKSTAFRILAGDEWFSDTVVDLKSRDRFAQINRAWVYEFAELASFRASRSDSIKAFLTSRDDVYRPPYARTEVHHKRRVVFVASTNEDEFLADYTGSRRFWPIRVKGPLDRQWLSEMRDQLWAEAVVAFKAGERWYLDDELEGLRAGESRQYQERDPWTELIAGWAQDRVDPFTMSDVLAKACKLDPSRQSMREMARASSILRALGYYACDGMVYIDSKQVMGRVWKLPGDVEDLEAARRRPAEMVEACEDDDESERIPM